MIGRQSQIITVKPYSVDKIAKIYSKMEILRFLLTMRWVKAGVITGGVCRLLNSPI